MGNLGVQVLPRSVHDRRALVVAATTHNARMNVAGGEMLVRRNPVDAGARIFLAASYVDVGRADDALRHLEVAIGLDPRSANAYNELAGAHLALERTGDARAAFERAAALSPDDDRKHFNLGMVLARLGRNGEATRAFAARENLALLAARGR